MNLFRIIRWSLCLYALCCVGCAAVNVDVGQTVDWSSVSRVAYQPPAEDPWQLTPTIQAELQKMGFTILAADDPAADLLVRYFTKDGPDLNADGDLLTRLKSLHVQFVDPNSNQNLAVVDYFYADTMADPNEESVALAFAELSKSIQSSKSVASPAPAAVAAPTIAPTATTTPVATTPTQEQPQAKTVNPPQATQPTQAAQPETISAKTAATTASPAPTEQPTPATVTPATDKSEARKIVPRTESPWVPRFHSWGFEDWAEEDPLDDY